jgi:hypothetical protein
MRQVLIAVLAVLALLNSTSRSQAFNQEPLDGPKRIFRDEFLENLVGYLHLESRTKDVEFPHAAKRFGGPADDFRRGRSSALALRI